MTKRVKLRTRSTSRPWRLVFIIQQISRLETKRRTFRGISALCPLVPATNDLDRKCEPCRDRVNTNKINCNWLNPYQSNARVQVHGPALIWKEACLEPSKFNQPWARLVICRLMRRGWRWVKRRGWPSPLSTTSRVGHLNRRSQKSLFIEQKKKGSNCFTGVVRDSSTR